MHVRSWMNFYTELRKLSNFTRYIQTEVFSCSIFQFVFSVTLAASPPSSLSHSLAYHWCLSSPMGIISSYERSSLSECFCIADWVHHKSNVCMSMRAYTTLIATWCSFTHACANGRNLLDVYSTPFSFLVCFHSTPVLRGKRAKSLVACLSCGEGWFAHRDSIILWSASNSSLTWSTKPSAPASSLSKWTQDNDCLCYNKTGPSALRNR